jgi:hypothetical protein
MLQIADAVEQTIISALLGPNHTAAEEEELRRKYRAGALTCHIMLIMHGISVWIVATRKITSYEEHAGRLLLAK